MGDTANALMLVSIEPRAYSQAIGEAIRHLKPCLTVKIVEPGDLGERVRELDPALVLCSQPNVFTANGRSFWIEYYPYAEPDEAKIRINGQSSSHGAVELYDLLDLVDEAL